MPKKQPQRIAANFEPDGKNQQAQEDRPKSDSVANIKETLAKLSIEVKNLGVVLGVNSKMPERPSPPSNDKERNVVAEALTQANTDTVDPKSDYSRPDMSQEEKKAQRAAKAAEKKARAAEAAAKKAQEAKEVSKEKQKKERGEAQTSGEANQPRNEGRPNAEIDQEQTEEKKQHVQVQNHQVRQQNKGGSNSETRMRSAMKSSGSLSNGKEVQFDLLANVVSKTESDEKLAQKHELSISPDVPLDDASLVAHVHSAFLVLTSRCEHGLIFDLEQLCKEFLTAFREFLHDWVSTRMREGSDPMTVGHDLDIAIRRQLGHLTQSGRWPLPYALGNLVRQMKKEIVKMDGTRTALFQESNDRTMAQVNVFDEWLEDSLQTNFSLAYDAIALHLSPKVQNAKLVLTYDWCPVVNHVLLASISNFPNLRVCVMDPELNGRGIRHVNSLVEKGYRCQYSDLKSIGYIISKCSMVLLGCSAILSNGCVAATKGAIQIGLAAKAFNVPLLVASQTFKFVDKVQTYSRVALMGRESMELIPLELVTAIVTDIRILAPTAAPAVLKAKALDLE